jgi:uncharacterized protein
MRNQSCIVAVAAASLWLVCSPDQARGSEAAPQGPPVYVIEAPLQQTGRITDAANAIPAALEGRLAAKLDELERKTLHDVVIVTVPTLADRDEAEVADQLGNNWAIGGTGRADGVVMLVAPKERRVRISTGDGIRGLLTDEVCRKIIDEVMLPRFREGDLPGGIEAGADSIIAQLS